MARDRMTTSWPSLQTDLRNAGATWVDRDVVVCTSGPLAAVEKRALANAVRTGRISDDVARRLSRNIDTDLEVKPHELAAELVDDDENDKDDEDNER